MSLAYCSVREQRRGSARSALRTRSSSAGGDLAPAARWARLDGRGAYFETVRHRENPGRTWGKKEREGVDQVRRRPT